MVLMRLKSIKLSMKGFINHILISEEATFTGYEANFAELNSKPFKRQPRKMVKHTETAFGHFEGSRLKRVLFIKEDVQRISFYQSGYLSLATNSLSFFRES